MGCRAAPWAAFVILCAALTVPWRAEAQEAPLPPAPQRWVTDSVGMLTLGTRSQLDATLESYQRQTGHQIVVWIGDSIGPTPIEDFSVRLFKAWQPGRKGQDDGALLIVLAKDRKLVIEVGYGLEGQLTDAASSRIINDLMVPRLKEGKADEALQAGVQGILSAIEGKAFDVNGQDPSGSTRSERGPPKLVSLILFGLLGLGFLFLLITNPSLALSLLVVLTSGGRGGGGGRGFGGFSGGGGRSGGGGARGSW